jgi:NAD+ synthase
LKTVDIKEAHKKIVDYIKFWFADKGDAPAVIGISGGKDSTICAALLAEALSKDRVIGVMMPNGIQKDISDSEKVIELLGIKRALINIEGAYEALRQQFLSDGHNPDDKPLYTTNTPARLRMTALYGIAAIYGGFVCNTCNLSEDFVGYSTKWGDCTGDFGLLCSLTKSEVVALGDELGLPKELVHKTPSDGMCGKSDEDNLGFTYEQLDKFVRRESDAEISDIPTNIIQKIVKMHENPNTKKKLVVNDYPRF